MAQSQAQLAADRLAAMKRAIKESESARETKTDKGEDYEWEE